MILEDLLKELNFKAVKSSGAGGQHVNKTSSKIELFFDLQNSNVLSDKAKEILLHKLNKKLTKDYILILQCDKSRSQHKNKDIVITRFIKLIETNLIIPKKRKSTKPTKSSIQKRLEKKKKQAYKKANRQKPKL